MSTKIQFAIMSGACAAAASLFGKLFGLPTFQDLIILRIIFFALMIVSNGCVWTLFVKALQYSESSLTATVTSAASNYILSAIIGYFILGEVTTLFWWSGMFLIMIGLIFIISDQDNSKSTGSDIKSKNR